MIFFTRHKILRLMSYWGKAVSWANFLPSVAWAFAQNYPAPNPPNVAHGTTSEILFMGPEKGKV